MKKTFSLLGIVSAIGVFILLCAVHFSTEPTKMITNEKAEIGDNDDPDARRQYELMLLRDPATGEIPRDIRKHEMAFAKTLPTKEEFGTGDSPTATWTSRGPWNVGGRTRALGIDVNNANLILAGGVSGGMWRSADAGATWTKVTVANSLHSVTCLAQDTRTGQTGTWYYGTGEYIGGSAGGGGAPYSGDGIFKSVDGGATWTLLAATSTGLPQTFDNFFDYVWNLVVDPTNGYVYAATYGAIYRSTNGGTNWSVVLGGAQPYSSITDIQVTTTGTFYATGSNEGAIGGVRKSSTGASGSWTVVTPSDLPASTRRIVVGIAPSNQNSVYLIAETPQAGLNSHSFWKYDAGANSSVNRTANLPAFGGNVGDFDSQGSYDLVIKVKPDNENVVIIGGTNLYRSTNGFTSTTATTWIGGYSTANDISLYPNHHPDQHSMVFKPGDPATLYSGHDGGVTRTSNVLATTVVWQQLNSGYLTTQCYTVAIDHSTSSSTILTGLQDNGCWGVTSSTPTAPWTSLSGGDGAFTAVANGGATYYTSAQNGVLYRYVVGGGLDARLDPTGGTGYIFINPFVLDPNNSTLVYFAGGNYVWRNSNITAIPSGNAQPTSINWTRLDGTLVSGNTAVSALAISKTNPANRLYFGHTSSPIRKVEGANTGSPTATDVTPAGVAQGSYVSSIAVDPADGNKVLASYSNYNIVSLYYTANGGASWTNVEGNLSGASGPSCRSVAIVPSGTGTTYFVGTSTGLYSTTTLNGTSTSWVQEGAATIGNVVVSSLDSRTTDGLVVAGTHANGTYSSGSGGGGGTTTTVYSGDANNDGLCDIRDILPIGRFYGLTGPARVGGSTTWGAQTATIWTNPDATHADCDGNGSVQAADVQALIDNYGRSRSSSPDTPVDRIGAATALLRAIDAQPVLSDPMKEIRSEIVRYMQTNLGITFDYALAQNYPNPFNPSTTIRFTVPQKTTSVELAIYNVGGQVVWTKTLANVETGNHDVVWNGETSVGQKVASGVYIYKLSAANFTSAKRMLLLK